jgi:hypothetical protein
MTPSSWNSMDCKRKRALAGRYSGRRLGGGAICPLIVKHFLPFMFQANKMCTELAGEPTSVCRNHTSLVLNDFRNGVLQPNLLHRWLPRVGMRLILEADGTHPCEMRSVVRRLS